MKRQVNFSGMRKTRKDKGRKRGRRSATIRTKNGTDINLKKRTVKTAKYKKAQRRNIAAVGAGAGLAAAGVAGAHAYKNRTRSMVKPIPIIQEPDNLLANPKKVRALGPTKRR